MPEENLRDPRIPPFILAAGTGAWKLFEYLEHVDFVLSIRSETFLVMFRFLVQYGWFLIAGVGILWFFVRYKAPKSNISADMVGVVGVVAFLWGMLITVYATGGVPRVIGSWGSAPGTCSASLDTSRLGEFSGTYDVALVCGITDPEQDKFTDTRITLSSLYTIHEQPILISVTQSDAMQKLLNKAASIGPSIVNIWYDAVLLPKDADLKAIHQLSDIPKYGGKILEDGYYQ